MPTYEYRCEVCGLLFPEHRDVEYRNEPSTCPDVMCFGETKRAWVPPAIGFKGSGWHKTDYK